MVCDGCGMVMVYVYDVGVGGERRDAVDFVEFSRAVGWVMCENVRDDVEMMENLIVYVLDVLRGDGGGDDGLESNVVVGAGRWLRARVADDDDDVMLF